ncbi:MAG: dockerin type I repeat-containing protein, partial [Oscillospiraceae bacterium]|nr:dockerin type I repeat-containing protein [Oscillospiraceae bacterium]
DEIAEKTLVMAKKTTDFYIWDPDCEIFDSEKTIPVEYRYDVQVWESDDTFGVSGSLDTECGVLTTKTITGDAVIHGYEGSTAQAYAEKYNRIFVPIAEPTGDLNGDGALTVADAVQLRKYLLGAPDAVPSDWTAADMYMDGRLDAFDLSIVKKMLLNQEGTR